MCVVKRDIVCVGTFRESETQRLPVCVRAAVKLPVFPSGLMFGVIMDLFALTCAVGALESPAWDFMNVHDLKCWGTRVTGGFRKERLMLLLLL